MQCEAYKLVAAAAQYVDLNVIRELSLEIRTEHTSASAVNYGLFYGLQREFVVFFFVSFSPPFNDG